MNHSQCYFPQASCWIAVLYLLAIPFIIEALERKKPSVTSLDDIIALNKAAIPNVNIKKNGFGIVSRWRKGMQELYEKDKPQTGYIVIQLYHGGPHSLVTVGYKTFIQWIYGNTENKTWIIEQDKATTDAHNKRIYRIDNRLRSILNSYPDDEIVKRAESQVSNTPKTIEKDDNCDDFSTWSIFGVDRGVTRFVYQDEFGKIFKKSQEPKMDIYMRIRVVNDRGDSSVNPTVDILNILGESLASDKTTKNEKETLGVKPYKKDVPEIWKMVGLGFLNGMLHHTFKLFGGALKPDGVDTKGLKGLKANAKQTVEMVELKRVVDTFNSGVVYNVGSMKTEKDMDTGKNVHVFVTKVHTWAKGDIWICVAPSREREALMTYHLRMEDFLDRQRNKSNVTLVLNADNAESAESIRYE